MSLQIKKKTLFYILFIIVYLVPTRISEAFLPYSAYVFYMAQFILGVVLIRQHTVFTRNRFTILLILFMLAGIPGMIINYSADSLSYLRYVCWFLSMLGLLQFFVYSAEDELEHFLKTAKTTFLFTCVLTEVYALGGDSAIASGFFWGSKAVTTQAWIMFITMALFYDLRYEKRVTFMTKVGYVWALYFCISKHSGQGTTMLLILMALMLLDFVFNKNILHYINPVVSTVGLGLAYYLVITLKFQDFDFIVQYVTQFLSKDVTLTGRDQIFSACLELFHEHRCFGYGFNNTIVNDVLGQRVMMFNTAHNSMLQMMLDYGIVGTGLFVAFIYLTLVELEKCNSQEYRVVYFSIISMFMGGLVNMIIGTNYFWMIIMIAVACNYREENRFIKCGRDI